MRLLPTAVFLTLVAWLCFSIVLVLARVTVPDDIAQTEALFAPLAECLSPCWQGIQPGISGTSSADAIQVLHAIPWVAQLSVIQGIVSHDSIVRWDWKPDAPPIINQNRDGRMWTHNGEIYLIELPLNINFATAMIVFGPPTSVEALRSPQSPPALFFHAFYNGGQMELQITVDCPGTFRQILAAQVTLYFVGEPQPAVAIPLRAVPTVCR